MEEGYIKFSCHWEKEDFLTQESILEINYYRKALWDLQLIGTLPNGIGFGNISRRWNGNQFIISGTNTGNIENLNQQNYALVYDCKIDLNSINCRGLTMASSESLTHAAIYEASNRINSVIHIHHTQFWDYLLKTAFTTSESIEYGTPEMAHSVKDIVIKNLNHDNLIIAMRGHPDGIIVCGKDLEETYQYLIINYNSFLDITNN